MNEFPRELQEAFREYREAHPDPEPGVDFMPRLWDRIESKRRTLHWMQRLTRVFVSASVVAALVLGVVLIPSVEKGPLPAGQYADVVAQDSSLEEMAYAINLHQVPDPAPSEAFVQ
jgi:negative regulator of sigma E activity